MTNRRKTKEQRPRSTAGGPISRTTIVATLAAGALAIAVLVAFVGTRSGDTAPEGPEDLVRTGEVNEMGLPVVSTPGSAAEVATAGGVEVTGAVWSMGQVPLEVAVRPTWTLVNTSDETVTLGEPHSEVRAGCCPGPLTLGDRRLAPGESTTLTFELSMHPGMDGWHDIAVHVPVAPRQGAEGLLDLAVTGDFRGVLAA